MKHNKSAIINRAKQLCRQNKVRFTKKRQQVFEQLLDYERPASAYDIADSYNKYHDASIAPMSVYRMLDFLIEQGLVHKLQSTNQFVPCAHITCSHSHGTAQFMICTKCKKTTEITLDSNITNSLQKTAHSAGFTINKEQLELMGVCNNCQ